MRRDQLSSIFGQPDENICPLKMNPFQLGQIFSSAPEIFKLVIWQPGLSSRSHQQRGQEGQDKNTLGHATIIRIPKRKEEEVPYLYTRCGKASWGRWCLTQNFTAGWWLWWASPQSTRNSKGIWHLVWCLVDGSVLSPMDAMSQKGSVLRKSLHPHRDATESPGQRSSNRGTMEEQ